MNCSCENTLRMPAAELNEAVLQAVERHDLTANAIEQVIHLTERDEIKEQKAALERERKDAASASTAPRGARRCRCR